MILFRLSSSDFYLYKLTKLFLFSSMVIQATPFNKNLRTIGSKLGTMMKPLDEIVVAHMTRQLALGICAILNSKRSASDVVNLLRKFS